MALATHSDFWASDESLFMIPLFGRGQLEREYERWVSRPFGSWLRAQNVTREEFFAALGLGINALFATRSNDKRWIDHTPGHAVMGHVLAAMFPGALFIHVLRDGRRVVNSMLNVWRTLTDSERTEMRDKGFLPRWAYDFREACKTWREHAEAAAMFCLQMPDRTLTIVHDALEKQPHDTCAQILRFLGAREEEGPATFLQTKRINTSYTARDGSPPPDRPALPSEEWTPDQHLIFHEEAGSAMARYGFSSKGENADSKTSSLPESGNAAATAPQAPNVDEEEGKKLLERIISGKLKLHYWNGEWHSGGLGPHMLRQLFDITYSFRSAGGATVLETGAGISTLVFLAAKPKKLLSIASKQDLVDRIRDRIQNFSLGSVEHEFYVNHSENVLPELARDGAASVDIAFIDGGHGLPTVFVDFCYANKMLKQGGYLVVDDVQLYSVRQLYLLLKRQPGFEIETELGKLVIFRKTDTAELLPDFARQPFVVNNT
jgi:precorrin-6B methylase 2